MEPYHFFNRDLSWLYFNGRVMEEAARDNVPLLERIKFLSIFSSNLDEFYRVRMPVIRALQKIDESNEAQNDANGKQPIIQQVKDLINAQQERFGGILREQLIPLLKKQNIHPVYNEPLPGIVEETVREYFLTEVLAFLQPVVL